MRRCKFLLFKTRLVLSSTFRHANVDVFTNRRFGERSLKSI